MEITGVLFVEVSVKRFTFEERTIVPRHLIETAKRCHVEVSTLNIRCILAFFLFKEDCLKNIKLKISFESRTISTYILRRKFGTYILSVIGVTPFRMILWTNDVFPSERPNISTFRSLSVLVTEHSKGALEV